MNTQRKNTLSWILLALIVCCAAYVLYLLFTVMVPQDKYLVRTPKNVTNELQGFSGSVMTAYVDYSCEYCRAFYRTTYPLIKSEYVDTGKIQFTFKDYPNGVLHREAYILHQMPYCAREQGKYYEMIDMLLTSEESPTVEGIKANIDNLGLQNKEEFLTCVDERKYDYLLQAYRNEAKDLGFTSTPAFILGERKIFGNQNIEFFRKEIDTYLDQRTSTTDL